MSQVVSLSCLWMEMKGAEQTHNCLNFLLKSWEKLEQSEILRNTEHILGPLEFTCVPHRGVKDPTLTLLNLLS